MHENAQANIRRQTKEALEACELEKSWPKFSTSYPKIQRLGNAIAKQLGAWLDADDAIAIIYERIWKTTRLDREGAPLDGMLVDGIGKERIGQLTNDIVDFFTSAPRTYIVKAPLPGDYSLDQEIELTETFSVVPEHRKPVEVSGLLSLAKTAISLDDPISPGKGARAAVAFQIKGICRADWSACTTRRALGTYKLTLQQVLASGLIRRREGPFLGLGGLGAHRYDKTNHHSMSFEDRTPHAAEPIDMVLPPEMCRFLDAHTLASDQSASAHSGDADLPERLARALRHAAAIADASTPEANRIRTAMEWALDSQTSTNSTISFLQMCIAFEAIFGEDQSDGDRLTKTLADRCAYLVGRSIDERDRIRKTFRKLYIARSKIIHGNAIGLERDQEYLLNWGSQILQTAIAKELLYLKQ